MNQEYDEYPTALAAAAFAIKSLEDTRVEVQRKANTGLDTSTNMSKSEDKTTKVSKPRTESRKFSDRRVSISEGTNKNMPEKVIAPAPSIKRSPTTADEQFNSIANVESKSAEPKKKDVSAPSVKKAPTFADKNLNKTATSENTFPKTDPQPTKPLTFPPNEITRPTISGTGNTKADVWEKAEMAKINERYEKLSATILEWENKKKTRAKRKMDKIEIELERRRAKAMKHYRTKMEMIDQIAGGARAQAEQNRRKEEVQVKDRANRIRTTGKSPPTCFCF